MNKQDKAAITAATKAIAEAQAEQGIAEAKFEAGCEEKRKANDERQRLAEIFDTAQRKTYRMKSDLEELKQSIKDRAKL